MLQKGIAPIVIIMIIMIIIGVLIIGGGGYYTVKKFQKSAVQVCTQEAKQCPDGSYVSRTEPNCEFAACPDITKDWSIYRNENYGFELKYPKEWKFSDQKDFWFCKNSIICFKDVTTYVFAISATRNDKYDSLDALYDDLNYCNSIKGADEICFGSPIDPEKVVSLSGVKYKISTGDAGYSEIQIIKKDSLIKMTLVKAAGSYIDEKIFDKILSTFKFIE